MRRVVVAVVVLGLLLATVGPSAGGAGAASVPAGAEGEVTRLYAAFFRREPDTAGLAHWVRVRLGGTSLAAVADHFATSDEFRATYGALDDTAFVTLVYRNVLGREPDPGGLAHWTTQLRTHSRGWVMVGFSESPEFKVRSGHVDTAALERLYRAFFRRAADADGLRAWSVHLAAGAPLTAIADAFAASDEFRATYGALDDTAFVTLVYRNVLGREPDPGGLAHWTAQLRTHSRGWVMVGFSESRELRGDSDRPGPQVGPCPLFPADSVWNTPVDTLARHPRSDQLVAAIGRTATVHPDFGAGQWNGGPIGIPITAVGAGQPGVTVRFTYASESDPGPYPVPRNAPIEHGSDHHVIVVDTDACVLHELYDVRWQADGSIAAGSGARWDLRSNLLRPAGWTSADAAGLPILPGLVRYDEVAAGAIDHAIRFTAPLTDRSYVWPARHQAGRSGTDLPPMGTRVRLRADVDRSRFTGQARVVAEALATYGAVLADNGSAWYLSGAPDPRWNDAELRQLRSLTGADFEVVDVSVLQVHPDSGAARTG